MSFDERYQLLELAGDEGAKTFVARETSTGKKVTVFLFVGEQASAQADFIVQLRTVDRTRFPELLETGDNRGTPYVVTEPIGGLSEFKSRLSHLKAAPTPAPAHKPGEFSKAGVWHVPGELKSPPPGGAAKVSQESTAAGTQTKAQTSAPSAPGSFTQMFQAPAAPIGESAPVAPEPPSPTPALTPPPATRGSFTQMFQAAAAPIGEPMSDVLKAPTPPQAPAPTASVPGSFTQMFQAAAAPIAEPAPQVPKAPAPPAPPKQAQPGPGEFTRFFSAASSSAPAPAPMPQKPESQGEFARVFGSDEKFAAEPTTVTGMFGQSSSASAPKQSEINPAPASPPAFAQPAGDFTKIFGDTAAIVPILSPMAPPPAPGTAPPPTPSAPGEYTRMFSAQTLPQEPPAEPIPAPIGTPEAAAPTKQPSKMIPVVIGIILLLLAVIAIIVISTRK
jgi:hypothetical protein